MPKSPEFSLSEDEAKQENGLEMMDAVENLTTNQLEEELKIGDKDIQRFKNMIKSIEERQEESIQELSKRKEQGEK